MKRNFDNFVLTNHALKMIGERRIPESFIYDTARTPDSIAPGKKSGTNVYTRQFDRQKVTLIIDATDSKQYVIISLWIDPPVPGTKDAHRKKEYFSYRKGSFWKKIFFLFKWQIFGK